MPHHKLQGMDITQHYVPGKEAAIGSASVAKPMADFGRNPSAHVTHMRLDSFFASLFSPPLGHVIMLLSGLLFFFFFCVLILCLSIALVVSVAYRSGLCGGAPPTHRMPTRKMRAPPPSDYNLGSSLHSGRFRLFHETPGALRQSKAKKWDSSGSGKGYGAQNAYPREAAETPTTTPPPPPPPPPARSASWESGWEKRRRERAEAHQTAVQQGWVKPRRSSERGANIVGQGCIGCDGLRHYALGCFRNMCAVCCERQLAGQCKWHAKQHSWA